MNLLVLAVWRRFICRRLTGGFVIVGEPLGDDLVNFRRKPKTDMSGADFDVLHVTTVLIDTSFPCDDGIRARVNRGHRCTERDLIAQFDFGLNRLNVDTAAVKPSSDNPRHRALYS